MCTSNDIATVYKGVDEHAYLVMVPGYIARQGGSLQTKQVTSYMKETLQ